ncbi:MmgE/PrpD family protein [Peribacillus sp. NPDC097264]|uniref:MmgE/PrpD family protein n=1 Tax=Peribacillus sp. NPDC097264 TaxID=3390616 RepID=UPI003CFDE3F9
MSVGTEHAYIVLNRFKKEGDSILEKWIEEVRTNDQFSFSDNTIHSAKRCLLDTLSLIIKGSTYPNMQPLSKVLVGTQSKQSSGYGIGFGNLESSDAALYNGTAAHSIELDDFYREGSVHPGVVVIPTALACGQEMNTSGDNLLKSIIIGYEIMSRVGIAAKGTLYNRGFHPTSICGVYGSAATSSFLYALSESETKMALGISGNFSFGLMAYKSNGAWTKRLNAGWAAKSGIMASKLASNGFIGPDNIIEGRYGYQQAFCEEFDASPFKEKQIKNFIIDVISFKPYSSCRFTHSPIDATLSLIDQHKIEIHEIEKIEIFTHKTAIEATMRPKERKYRPSTTVDAQFSIPYCLGLAIKHKNVLPEMFESNRLQDKEILNIANKVLAFEDKKYTELFPQHNACKVIIHAKKEIFEVEVTDSRGDPEFPLSDDEVIRKFRSLTENILSKVNQDKIIESVWSINEINDINEFTKYLKC